MLNRVIASIILKAAPNPVTRKPHRLVFFCTARHGPRGASMTVICATCPGRLFGAGLRSRRTCFGLSFPDFPGSDQLHRAPHDEPHPPIQWSIATPRASQERDPGGILVLLHLRRRATLDLCALPPRPRLHCRVRRWDCWSISAIFISSSSTEGRRQPAIRYCGPRPRTFSPKTGTMIGTTCPMRT